VTDDTAVVTIAGELHLGTVAEWEGRVESAAAGAPAVVLDLTELDFIDSAGVHALFRMVANADSHGSRLALVCPRERPARRLLQTLSLDTVVPMHETVDAARASAGTASRNVER
jgi:anti-sigma B factor antagonist